MGLVSSIVSYVSTLAQNAGVVPAGTNVATHARANDGAEVQDIYLDWGVTQDASGRLRVSQLTTLGDYKMLDYDRTVLMDTVGTGSGSWSNNKYTMSVQSGQYLIRYSRRFHPYFSGKSQMIEMTCDNFGLQTNVEKFIGGYSSSPTGTYGTNYDGFVLHNTGATYVLEAYRNGTKTVDVDWTLWDSYSLISNYNFNNFSVFLIDYLWLGGAIYRLWIKTNKGFVLLHTVHYSGTSADVITLSPNQPLRYEIRSSTGIGTFRYICAQVSTEGSINESGLTRVVSAPAITGATIGTTYPMKAIRKKVSCRDIGVSVEDLYMFLSSSSDQAIWSLQINPTLSAPLTYSDVTGAAIQEANGNGTITVTSPGTIIASSGISTNSVLPVGNLKLNFLSYLGSTINNTMDQYVLCMTPITNGVTANSGLSYKEI